MQELNTHILHISSPSFPSLDPTKENYKIECKLSESKPPSSKQSVISKTKTQRVSRN